MSAGFQLILDTTAPQGVVAKLNGDDGATASQDVSLTVTSTDTDVAQALIWGDVDPAFNASIQADEAGSSPISFSSPFAVRLSAGDGVKTIFVKLLDDVGNETGAAVSDTISLASTAPTVTITAGPTATTMDGAIPKISEVDGFDIASFTFSVDQDITAWKVKIVASQSDPDTAGAVIEETNGSTNMTGGALAASTGVNATINGSDLKAASAGDATKEIKVFAQNAAGTWSV